MNSDPPRPTREQLRSVLEVALGTSLHNGPRPLSAYEPLGWLLREDIGSPTARRTRRVVYRRLVRELAREFGDIYRERLAASNGPWDFRDIYVGTEHARKCIRRMQWAALQHLLHVPAAGAGAAEAYDAILRLLTSGEPAMVPAGSSIS